MIWVSWCCEISWCCRLWMCQCHKLYCQTIFHQSAPDKKKISRYQFLQIKVLLRENKISGSRDGWSTNALVDQGRPRCNCFCIFPAVIEFSLRLLHPKKPRPFHRGQNEPSFCHQLRQYLGTRVTNEVKVLFPLRLLAEDSLGYAT